jgi:hypothetical protein
MLTTLLGTSRIRARNHSATFTFRAEGSASGFECALVRVQRAKAGRPHYSPCSSPKSYTHLAGATYVFYVKARRANAVHHRFEIP